MNYSTNTITMVYSRAANMVLFTISSYGKLNIGYRFVNRQVACKERNVNETLMSQVCRLICTAFNREMGSSNV